MTNYSTDMYAFAVFKKANYIFSIESVPANIGGQIFFAIFLKNRLRFGFPIPNK